MTRGQQEFAAPHIPIPSRGWYHGVESASSRRRLEIEPKLHRIGQRYVGQRDPVRLVQIRCVAYLIGLAYITDDRYARVKVDGLPFGVYDKSCGRTAGTSKLIAYDDAIEARITRLNFCGKVSRVGRPIDGRTILKPLIAQLTATGG